MTAEHTEATEVGNYFVANYPPFSFWSPGRVPEALEALDSPPKQARDLGLYFHIPFCRKRCHFCYFRVYTDRNSSQIKAYMDAMIEEFRIVTSKALFKDRHPRFVYFGGGTPSYLASKQLNYLTEALQKIYPWQDAEEITFECEPGTLNEKKLKAIREMGVTRLSLGVENFNDHVLESNNRAHLSDSIFKAYEQAKALDFPQINIDLIAGMMNETEDNWQDCIDKTIEMDPDSVTIYQMEVPYNTTIYKEMKASGALTAPVANWATKRRWVSSAFEQLEAAGYKIGSAYTAVKKSSKDTRFVYRDSLWSGADLIPFGVASFGMVQGVHYQNMHDSTAYESKIAAGELPIYRAMTMTEEEQLVREFILKMKLGIIDRSAFREKFSVDVVEKFKAPLQKLIDAGFLTITDESLTLNREGLLRIDFHLEEFFLDEHKNARYV